MRIMPQIPGVGSAGAARLSASWLLAGVAGVPAGLVPPTVEA